MVLNTYTLLIDIYDRVEIKNIEQRNKEFKKVCNILSKCTNILDDDIAKFELIMLLLDDRIFALVEKLISSKDNVIYGFMVMREFLTVKYGEVICFEIIEGLFDVIGYYNKHIIRNLSPIIEYIIREKSESTNIDVATDGKLKYIKSKRQSISFKKSIDDDLPF